MRTNRENVQYEVESPSSSARAESTRRTSKRNMLSPHRVSSGRNLISHNGAHLLCKGRMEIPGSIRPDTLDSAV
jgi:hypothetical protein